MVDLLVKAWNQENEKNYAGNQACGVDDDRDPLLCFYFE